MAQVISLFHFLVFGAIKTEIPPTVSFCSDNKWKRLLRKLDLVWLINVFRKEQVGSENRSKVFFLCHCVHKPKKHSSQLSNINEDYLSQYLLPLTVSTRRCQEENTSCISYYIHQRTAALDLRALIKIYRPCVNHVLLSLVVYCLYWLSS